LTGYAGIVLAAGAGRAPRRRQAQAHADLDGRSALASAATLNQVLAGNVDDRGFVTNEHRYLAVAHLAVAEHAHPLLTS
jgi:hypothetical protein